MSGDMVKRCTPEVLTRVEAFYKSSGCTMAAIATKTGYSESYVSRYLSGTPAGDVEAFEAALLDMLDAAARRRRWDSVYFETEAVTRCFLYFELIDASNEVGLIHGPAGIGKTKACERYRSDHETAIHFCAREGDGTWYGMVRSIWQKLDTKGWPAKRRQSMGRADYIAGKLRNSDRLMIVDNAQRLSVSGIRWLLDMQDDAGFGLAFVGNTEILEKISSSDQLSSRIKIRRNVMLSDDDKETTDWLDDAADKMVATMWPDAARDIRRLARESARQKGHLRRLNSQLRIAIRLSESKRFAGKTPAAAFVESRHLLVTPTEEAS